MYPCNCGKCETCLGEQSKNETFYTLREKLHETEDPVKKDQILEEMAKVDKEE